MVTAGAQVSLSGMLFPVTALTNRHEPSGLKQHTFMILWFWNSEEHNSAHWGRIKVWTAFFLGTLRRTVSMLFPASRGYPHPVAYGPFLRPQASSTAPPNLFPGLTFLPVVFRVQGSL